MDKLEKNEENSATFVVVKFFEACDTETRERREGGREEEE